MIIYRDSAEVASLLPPFQDKTAMTLGALERISQDMRKQPAGKCLLSPITEICQRDDVPVSLDGKPINKGYAELRARWEPIAEVSQVKGDGESHPTLSPNDEFADFENWDWDNIGRSQDKEDWMLKHEYARGALKLGLKYEKKFGVNPFKVGLIASQTDTIH